MTLDELNAIALRHAIDNPKLTHAIKAHKYGSDLINKVVPAGPWVILAAERHLKDLDRYDNDEDYPYYFDPVAGERVCKFIGLLPHTKGRWAKAKQKIKLEPWQCFLIVTLFGWMRKSNHKRRFRSAYWELPRKNGKALQVDTPVQTVDGWKKHGDLRPGDRVFAPSGEQVAVLGISEHYDGPCFAVQVGDETIIAHERHEWQTERGGTLDEHLLETREIANTLRTLNGNFVHQIPVAKPLQFPTGPVSQETFETARTITSCDPVGDHTVNCIQVEGGMYLAGTRLIATHNSVTAAAIGLYMLLADGETGAECYSGATTERQAWEVFGPARLMLKATPDLQKTFSAEVCAKSLTSIKNGSKFQPLIGNPGDGQSPSCAIIDEYHEHLTPILHDTMETGMGAREQPLLLVITTAGYNLAGPCHEKHDEVIKVLQGLIENDNLFGCIFGIDEKVDDWFDPKILPKANPNFGISVDEEFLLSQQRNALTNPIQQTKVKTKHFNIWCSVATSWMNMQLWKLAEDKMLEEEELIHLDCPRWIGFDLASKLDLCAEQRLYRRDDLGDKPHYYMFGRYWLPEAAIEAQTQNQASYRKWVNMELLTQTDGAMVDFETVEEEIIADCKRINPLEVVFDPFNAMPMARALSDFGVKNVVEFKQSAQNFAVPMDEFMAALTDGRFHHDGNQITDWCMSNVVAAPAKKGLFWPTKQKGKDHQKIDGATAALMTMARACAQPEAQPIFQIFTL